MIGLYIPLFENNLCTSGIPVHMHIWPHVPCLSHTWHILKPVGRRKDIGTYHEKGIHNNTRWNFFMMLWSIHQINDWLTHLIFFFPRKGKQTKQLFFLGLIGSTYKPTHPNLHLKSNHHAVPKTLVRHLSFASSDIVFCLTIYSDKYCYCHTAACLEKVGNLGSLFPENFTFGGKIL